MPPPTSPQTAIVAASDECRSTIPSSRLATIVLDLVESPALRDGLRLIVLGGILEAARRAASLIFNEIYSRLTITARIEQHDPAYDWLMAWLSEPERQITARNFEVDTRSSQRETLTGWTPETGLMLLPNFRHMRWMTFQGTLLRIVRNQNNVLPGNPSESVTITSFSRSQSLTRALLISAHRSYTIRTQGRLLIHTPIRGLGGWTRVSERLPRSLDSVILERGVKEGVVRDVEGFLEDEGWYAERGIPHRRGYLLYGVPGSGKTSLITAIAGTLRLNLYVISLAQKGLDDSNLNSLVGSCPSRSIILMEDIDCAFTSRSSQEQDDKQALQGNGMVTRPALSASGVTLSGLLNCLDGVTAQEGSIFFATTNHVELLDPALSRPGRFDVWLQFHNATKTQARDLFLHFFPPPKLHVSTSDQSQKTEDKSEITEELDRIQLAQQFADCIPDGRYSVAALQGFLMGYKGQPGKAVEVFPTWVPPTSSARPSRSATPALA